MQGDRKSVRKPRAKTRTHDFTDRNRGVRLQKALADAGVAARRDCEELVLSGAVTVNGHTVDTLPAWVDPATDRIEVYGRPIRKAEAHVYVALFKPRGTVCTNSDPEGRPRAIDLVQHPSRARLYCVGRLDIDTSGLLVLTNDGEFANRLTHPRYGVAKGYDVTLDGSLGETEIARIEREIFRRDRAGSARGASSLKLVNRDPDKTVVHLELCEHRNLQIRPLMLELGHPVKKLRRTSFGPLRLKGLAVGEWRDLTPKEVEILRSASRGGGGGQALAPKSPKRTMEEFAAAREARAATLAAGAAATDAAAHARSPGTTTRTPPDTAASRGMSKTMREPRAKEGTRDARRGPAKEARGPAKPVRERDRPDERGSGGAKPFSRNGERGGSARSSGAKPFSRNGERGGSARSGGAKPFSRNGERGGSARSGGAKPFSRNGERGGSARSGGAKPFSRNGERGGDAYGRAGDRNRSSQGRSTKGRGR